MHTDADMMDAVKTGDVERVEQLLAEQPELVHAKDDDGASAILIAAYWSKRDVAEVLLAHEPRLNVFEAAAVGSLGHVKQLLAAERALAHTCSHDGFTPLHLAAFFGHTDVVVFLLAQNADVNAVARNPMKVQPLHSAAAGNHIEICRALIEHGADVNARQQGGFTPLHSAAQNGNAELVTLLLRHGAHPGATTDDGKTARDFAPEGEYDALAKVLS